MKLTVKKEDLFGFRTIKPSDYLTFGLLGLRTIGPSDYRTVTMSLHDVVIHVTCLH
jgi:hypothetical protein